MLTDGEHNVDLADPERQALKPARRRRWRPTSASRSLHPSTPAATPRRTTRTPREAAAAGENHRSVAEMTGANLLLPTTANNMLDVLPAD